MCDYCGCIPFWEDRTEEAYQMTHIRLANPLKIEIEAANGGWILRSLRWELPQVAPTWPEVIEHLVRAFSPVGYYSQESTGPTVELSAEDTDTDRIVVPPATKYPHVDAGDPKAAAKVLLDAHINCTGIMIPALEPARPLYVGALYTDENDRGVTHRFEIRDEETGRRWEAVWEGHSAKGEADRFWITKGPYSDDGTKPPPSGRPYTPRDYPDPTDPEIDPLKEET
jgi:hypothetical protein